MLARLGRAAVLAGLLVLPDPAWAADAPASEEGQALDVRRLAPEQRRRLLAGDTIAYQVLETSETELGAGVPMYLAVPLSRAAEVLTSADVVLKDPSTTTSGLIPAGATIAALHGITPYARRSGASDPAALLRVAAGDARIVSSLAPRLGEVLLRYPAEQSPTAISQVYWVKRQVQGRPTPILLHHLVDVTPALAVYVERQFYVGNTYNASQILCAAVPYEDGVLILSSNRVSTDQVAGLGGEMKRLIGRRQLRGEIVKRFDRIRAALVQPTGPPDRMESP